MVPLGLWIKISLRILAVKLKGQSNEPGIFYSESGKIFTFSCTILKCKRYNFPGYNKIKRGDCEREDAVMQYSWMDFNSVHIIALSVQPKVKFLFFCIFFVSLFIP